jgi:hypothetical protein
MFQVNLLISSMLGYLAGLWLIWMFSPVGLLDNYPLFLGSVAICIISIFVMATALLKLIPIITNQLFGLFKK